MGRTGNLATLTFSGLTYAVTKIKSPVYKRGVIDDSDLSTTDFMEVIAEDLAEIDEVEIDLVWDPTIALPDIHAVAATATITWPLGSDSTAATLAGTALLVELTPPEFVNNQRQEGSAKLKYDGKTGPTYTPAT